MAIPKHDPILTPADVAERFGVNVKTVTRWASRGQLPSIKTPGGHHRFKESVVLEFFANDGSAEVAAAKEAANSKGRMSTEELG